MMNKTFAVIGSLLTLGIIAPLLLAAYPNYIQMKANYTEGKDYVIDYRTAQSDTIVIAIHGGAIEPGTTEIANEIAEDKYSFYTNMGLRSSGNFDMHITSTDYDEPVALELVAKSERTLSIHGCRGTEPITYIGGLDKDLKEKVGSKLIEAGFIVEDAPSNIGAEDERNICNLNVNGAGVQLELTYELRTSFFKSMSLKGRQVKTEIFYKYSEAIKEALED